MALLALAVLVVLLLAPSVNFHTFSGLPLVSLPGNRDRRLSRPDISAG